MNRLLTNIRRPAPRWYRIFNRVYAPAETFIMALLLLLGYSHESLTMLIIKLCSSFIRQLLDAVLVESMQDDVSDQIITESAALPVKKYTVEEIANLHEELEKPHGQ